jgi:hypothetical protein
MSMAREIELEKMKNQQQSAKDDDALSVVTTVMNVKRRIRGEASVIQQKVFYKGNVYVIEEEVYSSEGHSSVYTSEDDFNEDKNIGPRFCKKFPLLKKHTEMSETGSGLKIGEKIGDKDSITT